MTTVDQLYALWRLTNHVDQPHRQRMRHQLQKIFTFRNLTIPWKNAAFSIPFLHHKSFKKCLQRFLRQTILRCKDLHLPFHIPTHKIREATHPKLFQTLFSHKHFLASLDVTQPPQCTCSQLQHLSDAIFHNGHLACPLENILRDHHLKHIATYSGSTSYFPSQTIFFQVATNSWLQWCKQHRLPSWLTQSFMDFIKLQWKLHLDS